MIPIELNNAVHILNPCPHRSVILSVHKSQEWLEPGNTETRSLPDDLDIFLLSVPRAPGPRQAMPWMTLVVPVSLEPRTLSFSLSPSTPTPLSQQVLIPYKSRRPPALTPPSLSL